MPDAEAAGTDTAAGWGRRWRIWVHALDRTGPPMLALSFVRWLRAEHPADEIEILSFRPGPLGADAEALGPLVVVLDDEEAWDLGRAAGPRGEVLRARLAGLAPVDVNLLVSVAAGQPLPLIHRDVGPLVTWVVEVGDDLHWVDPGGPFDGRSSCWIAGSEASARALAQRVPGGPTPRVVPEFVAPAVPADPAVVAACRASVGARADDLVVLGVGIGTVRKGLDLFLEAAATLDRDASVHLVWIGGERDPLWAPVRAEAKRRRLSRLEVRPPMADLAPWFEAADVFLHPAREDAFPLVCLHAAAASLPVVAFSGTGGVAEMFGDAFVGAPYPDLARLVSEVRVLGGDPKVREACGDRQRDAIRDRFLTPEAAPRLRAAVLEAVGSGTVAP